MSILSQSELQRLRYWQGQRLRSRDFHNQTAIEAQRRWWHNRALHNAFGVSLGLETSPVHESKNGPLIAIRVTGGLAYDCFGRELILQNTREIQVPSTPRQNGDNMTLLIRYKETAQFPQKSKISEVCLPDPYVPFEEVPDFLWKPSTRIEVTDGVPLAQVKSLNSDKPTWKWEGTDVPISRPLAKPCIASGSTIPRNTPWELWSIRVTGFEEGPREVPIGVQTRIDTSTAGFTQIPCYFAWLQGSLWDQESMPLVPFFNIAEVSMTGFTFRLLMLPFRLLMLLLMRHNDKVGLLLNESFLNEFFSFVRRQKLYICWLGCQMEREISIESPKQRNTQTLCL